MSQYHAYTNCANCNAMVPVRNERTTDLLRQGHRLMCANCRQQLAFETGREVGKREALHRELEY